MKEYVNPWDYAPHILKIINDGILLTTKADGEVDTMVISILQMKKRKSGMAE